MPERTSISLISQTARVVAAYLRSNTLPAEDLADLIHTTYTVLMGTQTPQQPVTPQPPAVPIKKSITPNAIICLECGGHKQMLKRHLQTAHGLTVDTYKEKWDLPTDYPTTAPEYSRLRSEYAKKLVSAKTPPRQSPR